MFMKRTPASPLAMPVLDGPSGRKPHLPPPSNVPTFLKQIAMKPKLTKFKISLALATTCYATTILK